MSAPNGHSTTRCSSLLGQSAIICALREDLARLAPNDHLVLITGEHGVGKEVVARALHSTSGRKGTFLGMNVCGMPASLLASMLFGHVRGAFTGADQPHEGFLARARGGTLLLDEIGDLPVEMQPSLLRMLELGVYTPLGSTQEVPVLARLVCATNADLVAKVDRREFRADLFWRLNVLRVHVPALAERRADIPELVRHFAAQEGVSFSEEAIQWLVLQPHPGNVRGLKNTVIRAAVSALTPVIQLADVQRMEGSAVAGPRRLRDQILAVERERVEAAFRASGGNLTKAGLLLGEDRRWVARRLRSAKMVRNGE